LALKRAQTSSKYDKIRWYVASILEATVAIGGTIAKNIAAAINAYSMAPF
jgi:hypothetical protein